MSEQTEDARTLADAATENQDQIQQIKDEVGKKYDSTKLTINRVPDKSVERLKTLAFEKFAGDYGMALAYLLEVHELKEQFDEKMTVTNQKVLELQDEVRSLKQELVEAQETQETGSKVDTIGWTELMGNDKLEKITAENKTFEVDGETFTVNPLTVEQFTKSQIHGQNDEGKALIEMFYYSLQEEEDITRQDLRDAPAKFMVPLQETVMEVNDFEDFFSEEEKQEALNKLQ